MGGRWRGVGGGRGVGGREGSVGKGKERGRVYNVHTDLPLHESGMSSSAGQATCMYALYAWKNISSASCFRANLQG